MKDPAEKSKHDRQQHHKRRQINQCEPDTGRVVRAAGDWLQLLRPQPQWQGENQNNGEARKQFHKITCAGKVIAPEPSVFLLTGTKSMRIYL